jgi:hypothetical protein
MAYYRKALDYFREIGSKAMVTEAERHLENGLNGIEGEH